MTLETLEEVAIQVEENASNIETLQSQVSQNTIDIYSKTQEINNELDNYKVVSTGNSNLIAENTQSIFTVASTIFNTGIESKSYTDQRYQEIMDYLSILVESLTSQIVASAVSQTSSNISNAITEANSSWNDKFQLMQEISNDTVSQVEEMEEFVENTINNTLPQLLESQNELVNQAQELSDSLTDEAMLSRQEAADLASRWRSLADSIQETIDAVSEYDFSKYIQVSQLLSQISSEYDGRFSNYENKVVTAVNDTSSLALSVENLSSTVDDQAATITTIQQTIVDDKQELSQQIQDISVGTQTQFDTYKIWYFNTSNEGWIGEWINGFVKVPMDTSPPAPNVDGTAYRQFKARLLKIGSPVWDGKYSYTTSTETGSGIAIDEPAWDSEGYGEITITKDWSGLINTFSLHLTNTNTATDYYMLDWAAFGRPTPGASTASVQEERTSRIAGDAANSVAIDSLTTRMNSTEGTLSGVATAISGLETTVSLVQGNMTSQSTQIDSLENTVTSLSSGLTSVSNAISTLTSNVSTQGNQISSISGQITSLNNTIGTLATASALNTLENTVNQQGNSISNISNSITSLNNTISTLASSSALSSLTSRVTAAENTITSQSAQITSLNNAINGKASTTALTSLSNTVTSQGNSINSISTQLTSLTATVNGKASAAAVTTLTARVTSTENNITSLSEQITSLTTNLNNNYAKSTTVNALTSTVTGLGNNYTALSASLTSTNASVGRMVASGLFYVRSEASNTGALTRVALSAQASSSDTSKTAALYLEANSNGTSSVLINADRFGIVNSVNNTKISPFVVDNGTVYINAEAVIKSASIGALKIKNNQLYANYVFTTPDVNIVRDYTYQTPRLVMSQTINGFEGGGFIAQFSAYIDNTMTVDSFGCMYMKINGVEVNRQRFGIRGSDGDVEFILPVTLMGIASASNSITIEVYAFNAHWNNETQTSNIFMMRNISLTIAGSRK